MAASISGTNLDDNLPGTLGNDVINGLAGNDELQGDEGNDTLNGGDGNDAAIGGAGADRIDGGTGADLLIGATGVDTLLGGAGDDHLTPDAFDPPSFDRVDDGDRDVVNGGAGLDTAELHFEAVTAGITASFRNSAVSLLLPYGTQVVNVERVNFFAGLGNDTITGGKFADTLDGGNGNDKLNGCDGNDALSGQAGNDWLIGMAGDDTVDGGNGADRLDGGAGKDQLFGDSFFGSTGNDTLNGGDGDDILDGRKGNDHLNGGAGIDATSLSFESAPSGIRYTLADGPVVTSFGTKTSTSIEEASIRGSSHNDSFTGGIGDDAFFDSAGSDTLNGGDGNDYFEDVNGNDHFNGGRGIDMALLSFQNASTGINFTLRDGPIVTSFGTKTLTSIEAVQVNGSEHADVINGTKYNDRFGGGDGDDTIYGGGGAEELTGDFGSDTFVYKATTDSRVGLADRIGDFASGEDTIDLSAIDADSNVPGNQAFTFIGDADFHRKPGELRIMIEVVDPFDFGHVLGDVNGDGVADLDIRLSRGGLPSQDDFVL